MKPSNWALKRIGAYGALIKGRARVFAPAWATVIGALIASQILPFPENILIEVIAQSLKREYLEVNLNAFNLGKKAFEDNFTRNAFND